MTEAQESPAVPGERIRAATVRDITVEEMLGLVRLRQAVFVLEQEITSEPEIDALDAAPGTEHLWIERGGEPVSVLRILTHDPAAVSIGRVATAREHRGQGLSGRLLREALDRLARRARETGDQRPVEIHAQAHLEQWYVRFGFERTGPDFQEAGIPHVPMTLRP